MTTTAKILKAITDTLTYTGGTWAPLGAIRDEVGGQRQEFDAALTELAKTRKVHLIAEENQKTITAGDRINALTIGGEAKHLARIA
jgi:hypothetical protein